MLPPRQYLKSCTYFSWRLEMPGKIVRPEFDYNGMSKLKL